MITSSPSTSRTLARWALIAALTACNGSSSDGSGEDTSGGENAGGDDWESDDWGDDEEPTVDEYETAVDDEEAPEES